MKQFALISILLLSGIAVAHAEKFVYRDIASTHRSARGAAAFQAAADYCASRTGEAADAPAFRQCMFGRGVRAQSAGAARVPLPGDARLASVSCDFPASLFGCEAAPVAKPSTRTARAPAPSASPGGSNFNTSPYDSPSSSPRYDPSADMAAANAEAATNAAVAAAQDQNNAAQAAATQTEVQFNTIYSVQP